MAGFIMPYRVTDFLNFATKSHDSHLIVANSASLLLYLATFLVKNAFSDFFLCYWGLWQQHLTVLIIHKIVIDQNQNRQVRVFKDQPEKCNWSASRIPKSPSLSDYQMEVELLKFWVARMHYSADWTCAVMLDLEMQQLNDLRLTIN